VTTLVQSAGTTWATGSQGTAKTITLPSSATVGNMVIVRISYSHDIINSVTGLGATWSQIQSREGSNANFESAEIWYCTVVTAGTTITITPNPSFGIDGGSAFADEVSGLTGSVSSTSTVSAHTNTTSRTSAALSASTGDLAVVVITHQNNAAPTSYSGSPGSWTNTSQTNYYGGGGSAGWVVTGLHIAAGSETPQLSASWTVTADGLIASAVFTAVNPDATVTGPVATVTVDAPAGTPTIDATVTGVVATIATDAAAGAATPAAIVTAPVATVAVAAPAGTATTAPDLTGYDLDSNASQALHLPRQLSGVLLAQVTADPPPAMTEAEVSIWKVTAVMPDPTLDAYGRPT
jgi:hypothetical protein